MDFHFLHWRQMRSFSYFKDSSTVTDLDLFFIEGVRILRTLSKWPLHFRKLTRGKIQSFWACFFLLCIFQKCLPGTFESSRYELYIIHNLREERISVSRYVSLKLEWSWHLWILCFLCFPFWWLYSSQLPQLSVVLILFQIPSPVFMLLAQICTSQSPQHLNLECPKPYSTSFSNMLFLDFSLFFHSGKLIFLDSVLILPCLTSSM